MPVKSSRITDSLLFFFSLPLSSPKKKGGGKKSPRSQSHTSHASMLLMQTNEPCKMRRSAVGNPHDGGYMWVIYKKGFRASARVALLDPKTLLEGRTFAVAHSSLWKAKLAHRLRLQRRIEKNACTAIDDTVHEPEVAEADQPGLLATSGSLWCNLVLVNREMDGLYCVAEATVCGTRTLLTLAHDGVTNCKVGAIVNAANEGCLGGGGVDARINELGGAVLAQARLALPILTGEEYGPRCKTGDAKITVAGDLKCDFVIHAVGPRFSYFGPFDYDLDVLENSYKSALMRAWEKGLTKVAFCILSSGIFRGGCTLEDIVERAFRGIANNVYEGLERVYLCAFTKDEFDAAMKIFL